MHVEAIDGLIPAELPVKVSEGDIYRIAIRNIIKIPLSLKRNY